MKEIPKSKRYAIGWYNEGITHLNINEYEDAMVFFEKALEIIPDHPDFLIGKGDVLFAMANYREAYRQYIKVLHIEPDNYKAWVKTGITLLRLEKDEEALEVLQRLLRMNPYDGEVWFAHGLALFKLGDKEKAKDSLVHARRYKPNQPVLWYTFALIEKNDDEAIRFLERGYNMDPTNLDILVELAKRLFRGDRIKDAIKYCQLALQIDPNNLRIKELLQLCIDATK